MAAEFAVPIADTPGTLARLGKALGQARVNIEAIQGTTHTGDGLVGFVPDSPERARRG